MPTDAGVRSAEWGWKLPHLALRGLADMYRDPAIRTGIKAGLAILLAFYWAQSLQLSRPTWCLFVVLFVMVANYVGAVVEKGVLRLLGTILGAVLGGFLAGGFLSAPGILLPAMFVIILVGTAYFGGSRYPDLPYFTSMTALVIVTSAVVAPDPIWSLSLTRVQEISLGVVASMLVANLLWPAYARTDFRRNLCKALADAKGFTMSRSRRLMARGPCDPAEVEEITRTFSTRIAKLTQLLYFGTRESYYFRARSEAFRNLVSEMNMLFEAALNLGQRLPAHSKYREVAEAEFRAIHDAIEQEFDALIDGGHDLEKENLAIEEACRRCEEHLAEVRATGALDEVPVSEVLEFSAHYVALRDVAARLASIRAIQHAMPKLEIGVAGVRTLSKEPDRPNPWKLSPFWIRNGFKGALSAILALLFVDWVNPPGAAMIPLTAWLFTILSRAMVGNQGDRGAFLRLARLAGQSLLYFPFMLLLSPILAEPLMMALFLFVGPFVFGYLFVKKGQSAGLITYVLLFVGAVSLNPQEPVGFQAIASAYFGVIVGVGISSVVQRFLWPVLPQWEIREEFPEFYRLCRRLLDRDLSGSELREIESQLALIPADLAPWIGAATTRDYPAGERQRLEQLLLTSQRLGYALLSIRRFDQLALPEEVHQAIDSGAEKVRAEFARTLEWLGGAFRSGDERKEQEACGLDCLVHSLENAVGRVRLDFFHQRITVFPNYISFLGAMEFFEETARHLDRCVEIVQTLSLKQYSGDTIL